MSSRQQSQIIGLLQFTRNQGAAEKSTAAPFHAISHDRRRGDAPTAKKHQVLPLRLDPRSPEVTPQAFARTGVAFHVIAHPVALDTNDF